MRVFISYRRSDSKDIAARIADKLGQLRELDSVFLDVDSIAHGEDFPERLNQEILQADAVIAVIGPGWTGDSGDDSPARIQSERDFVRKEIAAALATDRRIIPCLVNGAQMPSHSELPDDIAALADKNACSVRHTTFRADFEILCEAVIGKRPADKLSLAQLATGVILRAGGGLILAALAAIIVAASGIALAGVPLETLVGGRVQLGLVLFIIAAFFQIGTIRYVQRNS